LTALEKLNGNFAEGVETASEVLDIVGRVVPITLDNVRLRVNWPDGTSERGEGKIDVMQFEAVKGQPVLELEPAARINPEAAAAIRDADIVVISAGDIYTSIGSSLAVKGVTAALATTKATVIYVCNLVTKPGQTNGFTVSDHAAEIERLAGKPIIDYVFYNTAQPPTNLLDKYIKEGEVLVKVDADALANAHYKAIGAPLLDPQTAPVVKGDALATHRSLIRHDGDALAQKIIALARGEL